VVIFLPAFPRKHSCTHFLPRTCSMSCPSHSPWVQVVKLLVIQFSPTYPILFLFCKCCPQHSVLKQVSALPLLLETKFHIFLRSANVLNICYFTKLSVAQTLWRRIVGILVNDGLKSVQKGVRGLVWGNIPTFRWRDWGNHETPHSRGSFGSADVFFECDSFNIF
jgi:hypothetical protein